MIVRTNLRVGQSQDSLNRLASLGQVDRSQLPEFAQQALNQFDPNAVNALFRIVNGATGPQQFLSMVGSQANG